MDPPTGLAIILGAGLDSFTSFTTLGAGIELGSSSKSYCLGSLIVSLNCLGTLIFNLLASIALIESPFEICRARKATSIVSDRSIGGKSLFGSGFFKGFDVCGFDTSPLPVSGFTIFTVSGLTVFVASGLATTFFASALGS